jgi:hypothetical protein
LTVGEDKHPADEIGLALSRASGILTSIANCYEPSRAEFATGAAFIAEAVSAAEVIIARANACLSELYSNYSLQPLDEQDFVVELPLQSSGENEQPDPYEEKFTPRNNVSVLSDKLETILSALPEAPLQTANFVDHPARTYDELLYKLTAMTNVAATQNNPDDSLLPMLESLRADMLRIRSVA